MRARVLRYRSLLSEQHQGRALLLLALGALTGLALAGWGLFSSAPSGRLPTHAVALVNGKPILHSDFRSQIEVLEGEPFEKTSATQRRAVLASMVEEELFVQRGLEVGLPDSDPDVRAALSNAVRVQASADQRAAAINDDALRTLFTRDPQRYGKDFNAMRKRLSLDLRREQQQHAEAQLLKVLRERAQIIESSEVER